MPCRGVLLSVLLLVSMGAAARASEPPPARNLVPDPTFETAAAATSILRQSLLTPRWLFFPLAPPSAISLTKAVEGQSAAVTITGGQAFLHSGAFEVRAGQSYRIGFRAKGDGKGTLSAGFLWWRRYDDDEMMHATPHWTRAEAGAPLSTDLQERSVVFAAPEGATRAYVRFVVEGGAVTISDVTVAPAPAHAAPTTQAAPEKP